jgi:hypothetical protein
MTNVLFSCLKQARTTKAHGPELEIERLTLSLAATRRHARGPHDDK